MSTLNTSNGYNNYNSHVVGYESGRRRYETFGFTIPETNGTLPVINATLTSGECNKESIYCSVGGGATLTVKFSIGANFDQSTYYGTVDFSDTKPKLNFTKSCVLTPGNYNLYVYTETGTYGWRAFPNTSSAMNITLTLNYLSYTRCGAPTSAWSNKSIVEPGGKLKIEWSGAKNGEGGNDINGYNGWYKIGAGGWSRAFSTTNTFYEITIPSNASRAQDVYVSLQTIGAVNGYNSESTSAISVNCKINSLPSTPTLSYSSTIIPSNGSRSVTASAGSDSDSQTYQVKYNTENNKTTATLYTSALNILDGGTYYFWTWDGLECGDSVSVEFKKNTKPEVAIEKIEADLEGYFTDSEILNYIISPTIILTTSDGQLDTNTYNYCVYYSKQKESIDTTTTSVVLASSKNTSYKVNDLREKIGVDVYYKFWIQRYDGVEWSEWTTDGITRYIPAPTYRSCSNKPGYSSIIAPEAYFSSGIQPYFYSDSGYDQVVLTNDSGGISYHTVSLVQDNMGELVFGSFNNISETYYPRGQSKAFYVCLKNSSTGYMSPPINIGTFTRTLSLPSSSLMNLTWNGITSPYVATDTSLTFLNFFNSIDDNKAKYGFVDEPVYSIKATNGDISKTLFDFGSIPQSSSIAKIDITGQKTYELFANLGMNKDATSPYNIDIQISTTNAFGDTLTASMSKGVNWTSGTELTILSPGTLIINEPGFDSISYIKEGMPIELQGCEITSYHGAPTSLEIQGISNGNVVFKKIINNPSYVSMSDNPRHNSPISYSYDLEDMKIGAQNEDLIGVTFEFTFKNKVNQTIINQFKNTNVKILKHTPGSISLVSGSYNGNSISLNTRINDFGINPINYNNSDQILARFRSRFSYKTSQNGEWEVSNYIYNTEKNAGRTDFEISEEQNNSIFIFDRFGDLPYIIGRVSMTVETYTDIKENTLENGSVYQVFSNEFVIYNLSPTVSYRSNQVGINYDFSNNNLISNEDIKYKDGYGNKPENWGVAQSAFTVGAHSGKNLIVFKSSEGDRIIDISSGRLYGFEMNIDCGQYGIETVNTTNIELNGDINITNLVQSPDSVVIIKAE